TQPKAVANSLFPSKATSSMSSILQHQSATTTKLMIVGPSGEGKTGALASLVCAGYKLRILDFDNGIDNLFNLLTRDEYKYAPIIRQKGIDLNRAVRYETIAERMGMHRTEKRPVPRTARGWDRCISMLDNWQ